MCEIILTATEIDDLERREYLLITSSKALFEGTLVYEGTGKNTLENMVMLVLAEAFKIDKFLQMSFLIFLLRRVRSSLRFL